MTPEQGAATVLEAHPVARDITGLRRSIVRAIQDAVQRERDACATVAERFQEPADPADDGQPGRERWALMAQRIAVKIARVIRERGSSSRREAWMRATPQVGSVTSGDVMRDLFVARSAAAHVAGANAGTQNCMQRRTIPVILKVGALGAALVLLAGALAYGWLFLDDGPGAGAPYRLDFASVRAAANSIPGDLPTRIEVETLSHTAVPEIAIVSGTAWRKIDMVRNSYRVLFPRGSLLIEVGYDARLTHAAKADAFDPQAWSRVVTAMDEAGAIVVTHEHADHMGGLLVAPPHVQALARKSMLTPEQVADSAPIQPATWPTGFRSAIRPIRYDRILAIAPGVVLIKAPGHTPGSQMVFVRRADGQEYLFMGDTASLADDVRLNRIRSRYVTDFLTHDDRRAVLAQTSALHRLSVEQPAIALVPGHEP